MYVFTFYSALLSYMSEAINQATDATLMGVFMEYYPPPINMPQINALMLEKTIKLKHSQIQWNLQI